MNRLIPVLVVVAIGAAVLLRPVPPPAVPSGWSSAAPETRTGRPRHTPPAHAMVYVAGEVAHPGVYPVGPDARVRDALRLAGGARAGADLVAVNLAAHLRDGDEVAVPAHGSAPVAGTAGLHGHRRSHRSGGPRRAGPHAKHGRAHRGVPPAAEVDINTADAEELAAIPGIGDGLAKRIVLFREQNGAFASVDELLDVAGITEHRLDAMIPYVVAL